MKRRNMILFALTAWLAGGQLTTLQAQDWKSVLSGVASKVGEAIAGNTASATTLLGTWNYTGADCRFESDNLLAKAGGEVASKKVEEKMEEICGKIGLAGKSCSFTFNEDGSYTQTLNNRTQSGTYTFDEESKSITMKTTLGLSFTAQVSISGSTMSMLFKADKLMSLLKNTAGVISKKSTNTALSTLSSLSEQYDGLMLGFELKKQ